MCVYVCVCVCVRVCMVAKKHYVLWIMDPRAFSGSIWGMILGTGVPSQQEFGSVKYTCIRTYIHTYIPTYLQTYIRTYVHTYIHPPEHTVSSGYSGVHLGPFTDVHRIASAGCCGVCLGPSSCQTECQIRPQTERQNICQIECQNRYNARMNA